MDTIFAPITPLITSSVIVIRISGESSKDVFQLLTKRDNSDIKSNVSRETKYAIFTTKAGIKDDVLYTYFQNPYSYTGEDVVEISFHGNPVIVKSALETLASIGMRPAEPGEFTKRAFLNGKIDLTQSEAVLDLIESKSIIGAKCAYEQLNGSLKKDIEKSVSKIIDIMTIIEAHIDFPEEDLDKSVVAQIKSDVSELEKMLNELIEIYDRNKALRDGYSIAIVGRPNVGKSSLMNYLLKEERALVSDIPGTTRDYIDAVVHFSGVPINLIDTAGIRFTDDDLEKWGIERSLKKLSEADLVIVLMDASMSNDKEDDNILKSTQNNNRIIVGNKVDKGIVEQSRFDYLVSVKGGKGIKRLENKISEIVSNNDSDTFASNAMVTARQKALYEEALKYIYNVLNVIDFEDYDALAFELGAVLNILEEVTGKKYTQDILNNIFDNFCIGK